MNSIAQFEDRASRSRSQHVGESSYALCDRPSRTRDSSQRQLPTDHDYAVSTREYQTDQSSLNPAPAAARPVLEQRQKQQQRQKQPHRFAAIDRVTPYQIIFLDDVFFWWRNSAAMEWMAKAYGDDLRRKFLLAYDEGEDTLEELADRFLVSVGWAKKISAQRNRTGQAERVPHQPGRKWKTSAETQRQVQDWVASKPDLTLLQLQARLLNEAGVSLSLGRIWHLLKKLGLRLKKSRSMRSSATPKPTESGARSLRHVSGRSRRSA